MLNKGGGAKANIVLAMQSLADPEAAMGKDGTQRVMDNLNTRVWFRLDGRCNGEDGGRGPGHDQREPRRDYTQPEFSAAAARRPGGSRGAVQYVDRPLIRPEWMTGLPRGEAFVRTRGENWKLRVPLLKAVSKKEMETVAGHLWAWRRCLWS